ncbi:DUF2202 domain-containing protein [Candidatus Saccharibacteria bacterium]|nr:DUF2202 domain-containing protein [Candidatus Saccharibacteria bacterium]
MNTRNITKTLQQNWYFIVIIVLGLLLVAATTWAFTERSNVATLQNSSSNKPPVTDVREQLEAHGITPLTAAQASNRQSTTDELVYLIEEEKLAYDVYQVLYDTWGSRIFGNIKNSELSHQNMVLAVMESRGINDPRTGVPGTFTNQALQQLYDGLIAKGLQSQQDAYEVGITIEETDIADLERALADLDPKDTDIQGVLENLLQGSQNHLRAFTRQSSR